MLNLLKTNTAYVLMAAAMLTGTATAADKDAVKGLWLSAERTEVIEIKACNEGSRRVCGDRVWLKGADEADGVERLKGFRAAAGLWAKGKVVDGESGKKNDGRLELLADGSLKVSTCKRGLCTHETWSRVSEADVAALRSNLTAQNQ